MSGLVRVLYGLPGIVQRLIAGALLVGGVSVTIMVIGTVASAIGGRADALASDRATAGRLIAVIERERARPTDGNATIGADDLALRGPSVSVIGADLQNRLSAIAAGHGVTVSSAGAVQPRERDGVSLVGVRIAMNGPFEAVHAAITEMEEARPLLFIEKATLRTPRRRRAGGEAAALPLSAELEVLAAYILADGA